MKHEKYTGQVNNQADPFEGGTARDQTDRDALTGSLVTEFA